MDKKTLNNKTDEYSSSLKFTLKFNKVKEIIILFNLNIKTKVISILKE